MTNLMMMMDAIEAGNLEQVKEDLQVTSLSNELVAEMVCNHTDGARDLNEIWNWMDEEGQEILTALQLKELEAGLELLFKMRKDHFKEVI